MTDTVDVCVVGGCGRVGLPLGIALAARGQSVVLYDIDAAAVERVNSGVMPFAEEGAQEPLTEALAAGRLRATTDPAAVGLADALVVVVGTPVDSHLNPDLGAVPRAIERCVEHLRDGQLIVLRSTVYPGVTALTEKLLSAKGLVVDVAFCPERIAEGRAMTELFTLPQIIAARTPQALDRAEALFRNLTGKIVRLEPEEAELAKLFTNTWRYLKFAAANQFWMMANDFGLDFARIQQAVVHDYPRADDLPMPGFAAGPCLLKDTMQLAAFNRNNFVLGHSAMLINEGLPLYLVSRLEDRFDLAELSVGILGMAFKGGSDDTRDSLAYKLKKILTLKARETLCTDPYVTDDRLVPLDDVLKRADLLVIAAPHPDYAVLDTDKPVVDMWGLTGQGVRV
ncbi:nucleotide sugar dehydrogenase [Amorphoplanes digitatis]|uniref:UDP-N-acetyl-D-mannosaminuronic acid dehydrogenase n=1 Tax=Actinoplanes digitatis TaxID=1868 RepID=A0A7W7HSS4_9ACTN|nr:nucleotide sugar dehydrogenase [Actinoplanes digitatis]MBB4760141.1 UDP-N-acetyl-D-mannosaminuronic acid dehydrogenase [Actinoplanes digitatis]GID94847.1 UDP-N-acetyl-D-mannosamine dehydrogenase [Actinoplanes digitatis]